MSAPPLPPELTWRPAVPDDVDSIVALQDACFEVDGGYREVADEILDRFTSPMLDPETDTLVGISADGSLMVSIWTYIVPEPTDTWKVYDDNYIHPDIRSRPMRDAVMDWWMARATQRVTSDSRPLPIEFHHHVYPELQVEAKTFVESRGFTPAIYFQELRRDLADPIPEPQIPGGLSLVPADDVDRGSLLAARNDAFQDHRGSQPWTLDMWAQMLESSTRMPEASVAILDQGEPVAYSLCGSYPHDWPDLGYSEGWIEGVGTVRSHRGRGLASAVINASMGVFASKGLDFASLGVDTESPTGAHGLYARLGFTPVRMYVDYTLVTSQEGHSDG